jgi:hypothetical protein
MTRNKHRRGFVLLMALVIITFATLLLAGISRRSLQLATQANQAERRLQRRWASLSCQRCLLDRADSIFKRSDQRLGLAGNEPRFQVRFRLELGGEAYELVLADEDAKANLNTMLITGGAASVSHVVRRLGSGHRDSPPAIAVGSFSPTTQPTGMRPFRSWGQVFRVDRDSSSTAESIRRATTNLTCWGSGRLNLKRASDAAVNAMCEGWLDAKSIERLLGMRQDAAWGVAAIVNRLQPRERNRERLLQLLADDSTCYSLWIVRGETQNLRHELHIMEMGSVPRSTASVATARVGGTNSAEKNTQQMHFIW